jgi:hypothetical protein
MAWRADVAGRGVTVSNGLPPHTTARVSISPEAVDHLLAPQGGERVGVLGEGRGESGGEGVESLATPSPNPTPFPCEWRGAKTSTCLSILG